MHIAKQYAANISRYVFGADKWVIAKSVGITHPIGTLKLTLKTVG